MTILMNNASPQKPIITLKGVSHSFVDEAGGRFETLRNISFEVKNGEFLAILGPSGCGKSTLLRIISGIIAHTKGEVQFSDPDIKNNMAMIFQSFALFPWLTVGENVEFGLKMRNIAAHERDILVREHIQEMGLKGSEGVYPKDLSGGMKQRVGIARALALNPQVLLLDEPFSSLDAFTAKRLRQELLELWLKDRMTMVMVTHLVDEAVEMADRILVMTPLPGRVEAVVPVEFSRPRNPRAPDFFSLVDKIIEIVKV